MCPADMTCLRINDPQHQRQFRHTCKLRNCQYANQAWHNSLFVHPPESNRKDGEGSKTDDAAADTPAEAPDMSGRIVVYKLSDRSYLQLKGNWARVKLSKLRAQVEQCMNIPKRFQRFQLQDDGNGAREFIEDAACSECGIIPGAVIYVQSTENPADPQNPHATQPPPRFTPPVQPPIPPQPQPPPQSRANRPRRGENKMGAAASSSFQSHQGAGAWQQPMPHPHNTPSQAPLPVPAPGPPTAMAHSGPLSQPGGSPAMPYAPAPTYYPQPSTPYQMNPGGTGSEHSVHGPGYPNSSEDMLPPPGSGGWGSYPPGSGYREGPMQSYGSSVPRPDASMSGPNSFHGGYPQGGYYDGGGQMPYQGQGWQGEYPPYSSGMNSGMMGPGMEG